MNRIVKPPILAEHTPLNKRHGAASGIDTPPPGAAADWTIPQRWESFTHEEHSVWDLLFARQKRALAGRAATAFHQGLERLLLSRRGIPRFDELNERLFAQTGWTVVAVPGLIPDATFFEHLSNRRFPAGNFIRQRSQLDYLEEPDVFHDVFGHVPLLADARFADFVQELGKAGLEAIERGALQYVARLYWRTVEFGLVREQGSIRIYGAGILSSYGESRHSLESSQPQRREFDLREILSTPYRSDVFQDKYFIVDDLDSLFELVTSDSIVEAEPSDDPLPG